VPTYESRLRDETDPYLRQHMRNPVDWLPRGAMPSRSRSAWIDRSCCRAAIRPVTGAA